MPTEAYEAHLTLLFGLVQRFGSAIRPDKFPRIVLEGDSMNLPEVEVVCLQPSQRLLQHLHGQRGVPAVGADLGHEECPIAHTPKPLAQPIF